MAKIINLTPHAVAVLLPTGETQVFPSQGVARCEETCRQVGTIEGIPVFDKRYGQVYGIPPQQEGTYYVVSFYLRALLQDRTDILVPHQLVRDANGNIIGCSAFSVAENISIV